MTKLNQVEIPDDEEDSIDKLFENYHDRDALICFDTFLDLDVYYALMDHSNSLKKSKSESLNDILRDYLKLSDVPSRKWSRNAFTSHFWDDWKLSKHKCICLRYGRYDLYSKFRFSFDRWKFDHRGFETELTLLGRTIQFELHDSRHWNYKENRFYRKGEEEAELDSSESE